MNNKQKQHLLAYLGYYTGEINGELSKNFGESTRRFQTEYGGLEVDGICGSKTQKAMKHAVAYGMPGKEKNDFWENINPEDADTEEAREILDTENDEDMRAMAKEELDALVGLDSVKRMVKKIKAFAKKNQNEPEHSIVNYRIFARIFNTDM